MVAGGGRAGTAGGAVVASTSSTNANMNVTGITVGGGGTGGGGAGCEDDSCVSLLLCEETIPGSPAPDSDPAPPTRPHHLPFACAPQHHTHNVHNHKRNFFISFYIIIN